MTAEALTDFHNHVVPGVDDGSRTLEEALAAVDRLVEHGFTRVITTPHLSAGIFADPTAAEAQLDRVTRAFRSLAAEAAERHPDLELRRGHEIRLDVPTLSLTDERLRLGGTSFVLVEWPRFRIPPGSTPVLERIRSDGYRPVVAHPERYVGVLERLDRLSRWREAGAYLQMNFGSLSGRYGPEIRKAAHALLESGLVDYLCTDFHGREGYQLSRDGGVARLEALEADEQIRLLCETNPTRLFDDEPPLKVPPLKRTSGLADRIRSMFR